MKILVLNSGSSSQKACLYEIAESLPDRAPNPLWEAKVEFSPDSAAVTVRNYQGLKEKEKIDTPSREDALRYLLNTLCDGKVHVLASPSEIDVVGHRVVHGGPHFESPVVITAEVRSAIANTATLAPLHIRAEVEGMDLVRATLGTIPQVAVFDTGFHAQMPTVAAMYPGPYQWFENGIRRYGFHGINHQYCAGRAAQLLNKDLASLKIVTCHLGNGCSLAAIQGGRSIDTTMGFTPLEGLMMGTRSGSVDPGILIYLMRQTHLDPERVDKILNQESGLLGISGVSGDMRDILASIQDHPRSKLAFDIYVHRLRKAIGSMAAVMGGMDVLVFTAGVGENSPEVRAATCTGLDFLGIKLDRERNSQPRLDTDVANTGSSVRILVIRAQEDWAIARECWKLRDELSVEKHRAPQPLKN
ncbi:MAG TPA: acetate kinase [Terriglobales bacterium]|jgi:acetate kinase